ncbi:MAG: SAM-dependent chlorinase/fluorinase [Pseudomonadota bacterium]|nr:SAM-dependent chlorinase/fluorinase [Pseudomonadota bacterium]
MIALLTDFGHDGLYVGQLHAVVAAALPDLKVVDLCHTVPPQDIRAGAYLLPAYSAFLPPASVVVCVVDPGVGSERPHAACEASGHWYIGPDNGLFDVLEQQVHNFKKFHFQWPGEVSDSFHARDIYTPAACLLAESGDVEVLQAQQLETETLRFKPDFNGVIYFDHFGNAITGCRYSSLSKKPNIEIKGQCLPWARTFSEVEQGGCFWYENANGLVEIAANQGSARDALGLKLGDSFTLI